MLSLSSPQFSRPLRIQRGNVGAAGVGEAHQVLVVGDGHNAGIDRLVNARFVALFSKVEIGIGVVKILGNTGISASVELAFQEFDIFAL